MINKLFFKDFIIEAEYTGREGFHLPLLKLVI